MLRYQAFQGLTVYFARPVQDTPRPKRPEDARVEHVQLVPRHGRTLGTLPEDRKAARNKKVFEDPHVARHYLALHPALPGNRRDVELSCVREGDRFQEPRKCSHVARQGLGPDLLLDIDGGVGAHGARVSITHHQRHQTDAQGPVEVEVGQLGSHEWMECTCGYKAIVGLTLELAEQGHGPLPMKAADPAMTMRPDNKKWLEEKLRERQAGSPSRVPETGISKYRSTDSEAAGARRYSPTDMPPGSQPDPDQDSTESVSPSPTSREMDPPALQGMPVTFRERAKLNSRGKAVVQPTADLDELIETANVLVDPLKEILHRAAAAVPGARVYGARVEKGARLVQKAEERGGADTMGDLLGGRMWIESLEIADDIVAQLEAHGWRRPSKWGPLADDDFFWSGGKGGYRARHLQLTVPNGRMTVEVQLVPLEIGEIQAEAHEYYDVFRDTEVATREREAAEQKSLALFDGAWARFLERTGMECASAEQIHIPAVKFSGSRDGEHKTGAPGSSSTAWITGSSSGTR